MCSDLPIAHTWSVMEHCSSPQIIPSPKSQGFPSPLQKLRFLVMKTWGWTCGALHTDFVYPGESRGM